MGISAARRVVLDRAQGYVLFLWHYHQPPLVLPATKKQVEPYVRLHALRGYHDMPRWAEEKGIPACFNFSGTLLEQLELYALGGTDIFLDHTLVSARKLTPPQRSFILDNFFNTDLEHSIKPYPRYFELYLKKQRGKNFTERDLRDLQVWLNLSMFGVGLRQENARIKALMAKGRNFTEEDKKEVIAIQLEVIKDIINQYRKLMTQGLISVTVSPYAHPILPLLVDPQRAIESQPHILPPQFSHPDDVRAQLYLAAKIYERTFGQPPQGIWPSEGGVSMDIFPLIREAMPAVQYLFADAGIRERSEPRLGKNEWWKKVVPNGIDGYHVFFRDRGLSDDIGFVRMDRYTDTAFEVFSNILRMVEKARLLAGKNKPVVPLILDGENLQASRANDARDFIAGALYPYLTSDPRLVPILPEEYLELFPDSEKLSYLFPGSWIGTDFSTWTGNPAKVLEGYIRLGWAERLLQDLQVQLGIRFSPQARDSSRQEIYRQAASGNLFAGYSGLSPLARTQLLILQAESSCFRWWFAGMQGEAADLGVFDKQFRSLLAQAYIEMGLPVPDFLQRSIYTNRLWADSVKGVDVVTPSL